MEVSLIPIERLSQFFQYFGGRWKPPLRLTVSRYAFWLPSALYALPFIAFEADDAELAMFGIIATLLTC